MVRGLKVKLKNLIETVLGVVDLGHMVYFHKLTEAQTREQGTRKSHGLCFRCSPNYAFWKSTRRLVSSWFYGVGQSASS
jgi:hypothetical protein